MCQKLSNKMQQYTVYLYLQTAVHVSGVISSHHQELISLYLQYLTLLRPLLLPVVNVTGCEVQFSSSHDGRNSPEFCSKGPR